MLDPQENVDQPQMPVEQGSASVTPKFSIKERNLLIESCSMLVRSIAHKFHMDKDTTAELISIGNAKLVELADRYVPVKGVPFASYAYQRIWGSMMDYFRKSSKNPKISLNAPQHKDNDSATKLDSTPDTSPSTEEIVFMANVRIAINEIVRINLSPRDYEILAMYYGFGKYEKGHTRKEIAEIYKLREHNVNQIIWNARRKLKSVVALEQIYKDVA